MPIYNYKCTVENCNYEVRKLVTNKIEIVCPVCGSILEKSLPNISDPIIHEKLDPYRNKQVKKDLNNVMKARSKKHFVEVDLPELIEKHGEPFAKQMGWLDKNGHKKKFEDYK